MKKLAALASILIIGGVCYGDLIRFKDGIELGGANVEVLARTGEQWKVRVKYGTVLLDANRIDTVEIDYRARLDNLIAQGLDTPLNLLELAVLCDQIGMLDEAAETYAILLRKPNLSDKVLVQLAEIFEKRQLWPETKMAYERLLATNPADERLQGKVEFAADMAKDMPPIPVKLGGEEDDTTTPTATKPKVEEVVEAKPVQKVKEGLEANPQWRIEGWGNTATVETVIQGELNKVLAVNWSSRDKDKVAVRLNIDTDLTENSKLTFDIYNESDAPAQVCLAVSTFPGYQFFESMASSTGRGEWRKVEIDLNSNRFKSAATNWRHEARILNRDSVKDIFVLIYNRNQNGTVFIDNFLIQ